MYVDRKVTDRFSKMAKAVKVMALVGPRQSGKTTFLRHISGEFSGSYVTFDDPDVRELFEDIKTFESEYIEGNRLTILDEVQYGSDPGIKLKYLADRNHRLWITSSTEVILGTSVLSHLVGRISIQRLYPFDLGELSLSRGWKKITDSRERMVIEGMLKYGGYPGIVLQEDNEVKVNLLRDLLETILLKDVARVFTISDLDTLQRLAKFMAINIGSPLVIDNVCRDLGLSYSTMKKYMNALLKSYLLVEIPPFFTNRILEMKKQSRYYFLDMGLKNALLNDFSPALKGREFENLVISELIKSGFSPRFWRTKGGAEVEVVLEIGRAVIPVEIKTTVKGVRIERGYMSFIKKYKPDKGFIVGLDVEREEVRANDCIVRSVTLKELLMELHRINS